MNVDILDARSATVVDRCAGPTAGGQCPRLSQGAVACAGRRVASPDAGSEYWLLGVPQGSRQCPFAWDLADAGAL